MGKIIALIVGPSGSGKTTLCDLLNDKYGLKQIWSYTTRAPRSEDEIGHRFVTEAEMPDKTEMCAYTLYNGEHYWATHQQVDDADLYVIDKPGVEFFLKHYRGNKIPKIIKIDVPLIERMKRMAQRGDTELEIIRRCEFDKRSFRLIHHDARFINDDAEKCTDEIYQYLCEQEAKLVENP